MTDFERLMAYADGELDESGRRDVEAALAADPALRTQLAEQIRLKRALAAHYGPADEEVPDRFRALLVDAGQKEAAVVNLATERRKRDAGRPLWQSLSAIAATLVLGFMAGQLLPPAGGAGPVSVEDGRMFARSDLARALDLQLASDQPMDATHRIGVSFLNEEGRPCRTFDSAALSGLACRDDQRWQVMMAAAGEQGVATGAYRQANSGQALVMEAAQAMMADAPFDAAEERQARDAGWQTLLD